MFLAERFVPALLALLLSPAVGALAQEGTTEGPDGKQLFRRHCLQCHRSQGVSEGPLVGALQQMSGDQILTSMTVGKMQEQSAHLSSEEMMAIMLFLSAGDTSDRDAIPATAWCEQRSVSTEGIALEGWGAGLANLRHQPDSTLTKDRVARLELDWVFALPDVADARSQPVVSVDTIFVAAISGIVYALDRTSGCIKWDHDTETTLRTSMSIGAAGEQTALFIGDNVGTVRAINAHTGEPLWTRSVAQHSANTTTGTPVPHSDENGDRLYVPLSAFGVVLATNPKYECCKSRGAVLSLDAATGEILWVTHMTKEPVKTYVSSEGVQQWGPSGVPVWTTPTIDEERGQLYVGTGENTSSPATQLSDSIVALDLRTGAIRWSFQGTRGDAWNMACGRRKGPNCPEEDGPDYDFGAAAVLAEHSSGKDILVAGQKSGEVHALDPDTGELIWQEKVGAGSALGGIHWGLTVANDRVFVPINDPAFPRPGYVAKPGVYALDLLTGETLWEHKAERACELDLAKLRASETPWPECPFQFAFSAAPMSNSDVIFAASLDGRVFAFDQETGEVLWQDHTVKAYDGVNGIEAHGGSIDSSGVQLAGDMLLVNSGYSLFGQMPGNALMVYRVK